MVRITVAVGLGALAEELYLAHRVNELTPPYRRLYELRRRILQEVEEKAGEDVAEIISNIATAIQRYAPEIEETLEGLRRLGAPRSYFDRERYLRKAFVVVDSDYIILKHLHLPFTQLLYYVERRH